MSKYKSIQNKDLGSCLEFIMSQKNVVKVEITKGEITVFYSSEEENGVIHTHFGFGSHLDSNEFQKDEEAWKIGTVLASRFFSSEPE